MSSEHVLELTETSFDREVLEAPGPVLVDFWAAWCPPCRVVAPVIDELAGAYAGRARVGKVDVDTNPTLASRFGISTIPTLAVFRDGAIVERFVGVTSRDDLAVALVRAAA